MAPRKKPDKKNKKDKATFKMIPKEDSEDSVKKHVPPPKKMKTERDFKAARYGHPQLLKVNKKILQDFPGANQDLQKELMSEMLLNTDFYDEYFAA